MKQFKNIEELESYIMSCNHEDENELFGVREATTEEIIEKLVEDGYDLENLTADGYVYDIGGHTNNGKIIEAPAYWHGEYRSWCKAGCPSEQEVVESRNTGFDF